MTANKSVNDDFLAKKRESGPILDLSKLSVTNKDEFRKLMERVPDFRMKAERVRPEEFKLKEKKFRWRTAPSKQRRNEEVYTFADPIPVEMRSLDVRELAAVPIDWKMLTTLRPKSQVDQAYYSRLIELAKLEKKTEANERRLAVTHPSVRKLKNRAGIVEMRPINCSDCGEDLCTGEICCQTNYEQFVRVPVSAATAVSLKAKDLSILDKHGIKIKGKKSKGKAKIIEKKSAKQKKSTSKGKNKNKISASKKSNKLIKSSVA